jgi:hypothetical protein
MKGGRVVGGDGKKLNLGGTGERRFYQRKVVEKSVSVIYLMDREWRRLKFSPADRNDYLQLELPGAWEPLGSS